MPLIDPKIDCVFKAILGAPENTPLLIHFLNGVLTPESPITDVEILNPYNEKEYLSDKLTIVDIKARDAANNTYQVELQLNVFPYLPERMLYCWSDIYGAQIQSGQDYHKLQPSISIWLLGENLFKDSDCYHHRFQMADLEQQRVLSPHCAIHVLELEKWRRHHNLEAKDQWMYFFKDADKWEVLPTELDTEEMRQAMAILKRFSEKEQDYHLYQARQNILREEKSRQRSLSEAVKAMNDERRQKEAALKKEQEERRQKEAALKKEQEERRQKEAALKKEQEERRQKEAALKKEQEERRQKEAALQEKQRLYALLKKAGIDPDSE